MTTELDAPTKLFKFRDRHGISLKKAGDALGASGPTVLDWERRRKVPTPPFRRAIAVWTKGEIGEDEWESDKERQIAERTANVQPFEPEPAPDSEDPAPESQRAPTGATPETKASHDAAE